MAFKSYLTINGKIHGEVTGGVATGYATDALGSVVATVDNSGSVANTYRYKPYGAALKKSGVREAPLFQWRGTRQCSFTDLLASDYYSGGRHYDSLQGVFTTPRNSGGQWSAGPPNPFDIRVVVGGRIYRATADELLNCTRMCTSDSDNWHVVPPQWDSLGGYRTLISGKYQTCMRCCIGDALFAKIPSSVSGSPVRSCATVKLCRRHLQGFFGSIGIPHTFLWTDWNCNGKWNPGEFHGFGGPSDYELSPDYRKYYPKDNTPCPPEMPVDVFRYFTSDVECQDLNCDPRCVKRFMAAYFGPGKCFDPTATKQLSGNAWPGGYSGSEPDRRCWGFTHKIIMKCNCSKLGDFKGIVPPGTGCGRPGYIVPTYSGPGPGTRWPVY